MSNIKISQLNYVDKLGFTPNDLYVLVNYQLPSGTTVHTKITDLRDYILSGAADNNTFVTAYTYNDNTFTIFDNSGNTFSSTINDVTGLTVNGFLYVNNSVNTNDINIAGLGLYNNDATGTFGKEIINHDTLENYVKLKDVYVTGATYTASTTDTNQTFLKLQYHSTPLGGPYVISSQDTFTTGGTYDNNTTKITFDKNDGTQYDVILSGIDVNDTYVTGGTLTQPTNSDNNGLINLEYNQDVSPGTYSLPYTDTFITGFTYSDNLFELKDNSGNTFGQFINVVTGLTVNGDLYISGNTYQNGDFFITGSTNLSGLTLYYQSVSGTNPYEIVNVDYLTGFVQTNDVYVTGATYTASTNDTNYTQWEFQYHGTPIGTPPYIYSGENTFTTGGTYDNNTSLITFLRNDGNTGYTVDLSGIDVNDTYVTGGTNNSATTSSPNATIDLLYNQDVPPSTYSLPYSNVFVTGFTYTANTFTIFDNSGNTFPQTINEVTGLTVNGLLSATTISADTIGNVKYIDFDITQTGATDAPGRLFWDVNNRTLSLGMIGGPVQQIGEEQYYLVQNQTSGPLSDGTVVRAVGVSGNTLLVDKMIANGTIPAFTTLGVLTQPLNVGEIGYVTSFGLVRGINTTGSLYGESWGNGTVLYVSPTYLGGFTNVKPTTPNQDIIIAIVMSAGTNGTIFVRPDVYRPFKDPNRITVAKQNGDFTSIKDAVDSITGSSSSNRYVIDVGPGEFIEGPIDLSTKPYISIVGSNIQTTLVIPSGNTQHIIQVGSNNEISFLSLSGAGSGYAAIYSYDVTDFGQVHKISIYDCDTGIWVESNNNDTAFYGEYVDINGNYTYGVQSISNNGYNCLANLENYYLFPSTIPSVTGNYSFGSGATINVTSSLLQGNNNTGSTCFNVYNGGYANVSATDINFWGTGLLVPVAADPSRFEFNGVTFGNDILDIKVNQSSASGVFIGIADHEKVQTVSSDIYWNFLDSQDGELDITRKGSVTFADGTHTDFTTLIFEGSSMGLLSGGTLTVVSGTTIQADGGFGYVEKTVETGIIKRIDWLSTQITLSANTNNYVFINENGILSVSGGRPDSESNILLGRVVTNSTNVEFIDLTPFDAEHTSNKYNSLFSEAIGPIYAFGSIVTEGTSAFTLDVTAGEYYFSTNEINPVGGTGLTFTQYYRNGTGSTWITSATTLVNNTQFDDNGTLTTLTGYTKHTLYVLGEGTYEKYFLVLGQNQYDTLVQTENALLPTSPSYFSDSVTQIANIYVQSGTTGITQIEDIRPVIGFRAGGVNASSVHGNLLGLTSDDHKQYLLVDGSRPMSGNLDMGGNNIVSAGTINGVTIELHGTRHQFGGADPVGSLTPTNYAIPYASAMAKLDDWISTATTSTLGLVKLSTSPVSASNPIVVGENDLRFQNSFTGASFSDLTDTLTLTRVDGTTLPVTGFTDYFVTAFTYDNANTITLSQNNGQTTGVTINQVTGLTINGNLTVTGNTNLSGLTQYDETVSGTNPFEVVNVNYLTGFVETTDVYVTGTTYTPATNATNYTQWQLQYHGTPLGGPYAISGENTFVTAFTYNNANTITLSQNNGQSTGVTINQVTGLTINGNLTVTGNTTLNTLSASTFTASTYYNVPVTLPIDFGFDGTYANNGTGFAQIPLTIVILSASTYNSTYTGMTGVLVCDVSQTDVATTGEFELYNLTDAASIAGSTTSFTNADGLKSSSSFSISSSNFKKSFRIRMRRTSVANNNVRMRAAQLIITLT